MNYINEQSFRCLLGPQSKNVQIYDNLYLWNVGKKKHFTVSGKLSDQNLLILKEYGTSNFHYISENNLNILKQNFKVNKSKNLSVVLDIRDLSFSGSQYKKIRHCLNRCEKEGFVIENNYRSIHDVMKLVDEWSTNYTDKYFRDNSGKNTYFYKNNFHDGLISVFVYKENDLVAFGTLSNNVNGYSSYVLGKSLWKRHYGLSEFADVELYKLGIEKGIEFVNMGAATKGLVHYKTKFKHYTELHFDGSINS